MLRMLISSHSATKRRHVLPFNFQPFLWTICQRWDAAAMPKGDLPTQFGMEHAESKNDSDMHQGKWGFP